MGAGETAAQFIEMDQFDWEEKFKPIPNHIEKGTTMFETFGKEVEFVKSCPENRIWTLLESDDGDMIIVEGFHFVNRLGYYVTEAPYEPNTNYQIV